MWSPKRKIARAEAHEEDAQQLAQKGHYQEAAERLIAAAGCWREAKRLAKAADCEAQAHELLARHIQDLGLLIHAAQAYAEMEVNLSKAQQLFRKAKKLEEASRISGLRGFLQNVLLLAVSGLAPAAGSGNFRETLDEFQTAYVEAKKIRDSSQASFAEGLVHICRSYITDDDSEKVEELDQARTRFMPYWPIRALAAEANQLEVKAMKAAREEDYAKGMQDMLEASRKWMSTGHEHKARWCELESAQYSLELQLLSSLDIDYSGLSGGYLSISQGFTKAGYDSDALWCELWSRIHKSVGQNDIKGFRQARDRLRLEFPGALEPKRPSRRAHRRLLVLLDHSEKIEDFVEARALEHEAFRLEHAIRELIRAFDGRKIEGKIFSSEESQSLVLNRYQKIERFIHNEPTYEEEREYAEAHQVNFPVEVDIVAEREVAQCYCVLVAEVTLHVDEYEVANTAKKAGIVLAYYRGRSRYEASQGPSKGRPRIEGIWLFTNRDVDPTCSERALAAGVQIIDRRGLGALFDSFGMRQVIE